MKINEIDVEESTEKVTVIERAARAIKATIEVLTERRIFTRVYYMRERDVETPHLPDRGDRHFIRRIDNEDLKTGTFDGGCQVL